VSFVVGNSHKPPIGSDFAAAAGVLTSPVSFHHVSPPLPLPFSPATSSTSKKSFAPVLGEGITLTTLKIQTAQQPLRFCVIPFVEEPQPVPGNGHRRSRRLGIRLQEIASVAQSRRVGPDLSPIVIFSICCVSS
jgi:hypothetical protein